MNINDFSFFISLIFCSLTPIGESPFFQRALIARNKKQFLYSFYGSAMLIIPIILVTCAIASIAYYQNSNIPQGQVLYYFMSSLPVGMKGLLIAGLLAAIMSTQDSYLNATSSIMSRDVLKQIMSYLNKKQELLFARISCILIALISLMVVFFQKILCHNMGG